MSASADLADSADSRFPRAAERTDLRKALRSFPHLVVFHMARKLRETENKLLRRAETTLGDLLPSDWLLSRQAESGDSPFDAQLTIGPSADESATILVEAKPKVGPRDVQRLTERWRA